VPSPEGGRLDVFAAEDGQALLARERVPNEHPGRAEVTTRRAADVKRAAAAERQHGLAGGKSSGGAQPHERQRHETRPEGMRGSKPSGGGGTLKTERTGRGNAREINVDPASYACCRGRNLMRGTAKLQLFLRSPARGQALKEAQLHERHSLQCSHRSGTPRVGNTSGSMDGRSTGLRYVSREASVPKDAGGSLNQ